VSKTIHRLIRLTARTVAVWCDGHFEDNVTYALKDTPCGDVVGKTVCCFPATVSQLFPNDHVLQELRAESYVGVTLWSHTLQPIGLIAVISRRPLVNRQLAENIMNLVGVRAAGEMERLESLGVLSGGIAHDFNNILAIIIGNCSLAEMNNEKAIEYIPQIVKAANRAAELCCQMLAYAGKAQVVQSQINIVALVDEMVKMLKASTNQNAEIEYERFMDIPLVSGDASQIRQVVMNLIINASEAIGKAQGKIIVSLAKTVITNKKPVKDHQGKTIQSGWYVCLEVTDNGCGMDNETRQRIFEPFYTTKFTGRGLGMSAVLGIIMSHCGALQIFSALGQGTTFKVYLPIPNNESVGDNVAQEASLAPWTGSGTILLVEDEDQIRSIAKALLSKLGFTVIEALNGKEALELYQENAADVTLVVTDVGSYEN
jgi:signal transduction histidine kinase